MKCKPKTRTQLRLEKLAALKHLKPSSLPPETMVVLAEDPNARLIPLTKGAFAIVDAERFDMLSCFNWFFNGGYAKRHGPIFMHRMVISAPNGICVDHINGNKLDNRLSNLRLATRSENCRNRKLNSNNSTGYRGVSFHKKRNRFMASIRTNWKLETIGYFKSALDAHKAYVAASLKLHGEFSNLS